MRFLFVTIQPFSSYASYKRATGLGEALANLGHDVHIAALDCEVNRELLRFEAPHCHPIYFPKTNAMAEVFFKLRHIRRIKPDYVYSPTYGLRNLMGFRIFFPRNTKLLQEINELNSSFSEDHRIIWKFIEWLGMLEADIQICASKMLQAHIDAICAKWHMRKKTFYSPFAFPPYLNLPNNAPRPTDRQTILFFGSIVSFYGIFEILKAFPLLTQRRTNTMLVIVGTGPDLDNANRFVRQHGLSRSVKFAGRVDEREIDAWLRLSDVFVAPMHDTPRDWFRCPSKLFYYIAYGKPIVTCRIGDPFDNLKEHGFYYQPSDIESLRRAMAEALDHNDFQYPPGFIESHSWSYRATELIQMLKVRTNGNN